MEVKIISIVSKDLKIYARQKKTLLLMILCPVLIMLLVGSVFSGAPEGGLKGVTLGVSGSNTSLGKGIIESLERQEMFTITKEVNASPEELERKVRAGEYSAGIVLPVNETDALKLFLDNSKLQVAPVISSVFITVTEKLSYEITLEFIEQLWTSLEEMEARMGPLGDEIRGVRDNIIGINDDAKDIRDSLDLLDILGLNASILQMEETLKDMGAELNKTRGELSDTRIEILDLNSTVNSINTDTSELRDQLGVVVENINSTDSALLDLGQGLSEVYNATCLNQTLDPRCISIAATKGQMESTRTLLKNRTSKIVSLYDNLGKVANTSDELQSRLAEMDGRLQKMDESMIGYIRQIDSIKGNISGIKNTTGSLKKIKEDATQTFSEVDTLTGQINKSSEELLQNIKSTKDMLSEVTSRPPSVVAASIKLDRLNAFEGKSHLDFLMPGIIAIVLMFVCFLLSSITIIQEKTRGTLLRTLVSPLTLPELLLGKTLGLLLIACLQGVILVVMAFSIYGISLDPGQLFPLFVAIIVYSASFISVGMVIASFADSENMAMLSSLVISIPMLFLCGVFYPFEMMPKIMASFGNYLPITMGIEIFRDILVYQKGIVLEKLSGLSAYFALSLAVAYLQMRKELIG